MLLRGGAIATAFAVLLGGGTAAAVSAASPHARLTRSTCHRALQPRDRMVAITAVMRPVPGTHRMHLRFELLRRWPGGAFAEVSGGDLGRWKSPPDATLGQHPDDVWRLRKLVLNLAAPATYRFRVTFRWSGAHGRTLSEAIRLSRTCYQPELRPDLLVAAITVKRASGNPGNNVYTAVIRNAGATRAGHFDVQFTDAGAVQRESVAGLRAHGTVKVTFVGPVCTPAGAPTITADPDHLVDDYDRADNSLTATCPASGGGGASAARSHLDPDRAG
jgi:hypothetical protein